MKLTKEIMDCQNPQDGYNINRRYTVVRVTLEKNTPEYNAILAHAEKLSGLVNAGAANESAFSRDNRRKLIDAFAGLLSEYAWRDFLNLNLNNIASFTQFDDAANQIDIELAKGEKIEVRSSTVRKGVKFALCNNKFNFKNIGPYSNSIKTTEIQKDFYCGVLFDTQKETLLSDREIVFYLVGSSTWKMMMEIGINAPLNADNAIALEPGNYRIIEYKNTLDVDEFLEHLKSVGY